MMSKSFSTREKVLLVILGLLLVLGLYYLVVLKPTMETISVAQAEIDGIADLMIVEEAKAEQLQVMRKALDELEGTEEAKTVTPLYDNFQNLLDELNSALATADDYKLSFLAPTVNEGVATRQLQLVFYSRNYYAAKSIINKLYSGPYRCDITSFKLAPTEKDSHNLTSAPVEATLSIQYYEIYKNA